MNNQSVLFPTLRVLALSLFALIVSVSTGVAATDSPPNRMSFQSYLTDDLGVPVGGTGSVNKKMIFTIWDADSGGTEKWAEEQIVTVDAGHFSVILGEGSTVSVINHDLETVFNAADASDRFIEVFVSDTDDSNPQTLSPRLRLLPSSYAYLATFARTADALAEPLAAAGLADNAVTTIKIADANITTPKIADGNVTEAKIADSSVTGDKIAYQAVTYDKIDREAVRRYHLFSEAVSSEQVEDNSLTASDLASNSVGASEIATGAVGTSEIQDGAVATADLADQAVTAAKFQKGLFVLEKYSLNLTSDEDEIQTSVQVANYYPTIVGFSFGTGDVNENGDHRLTEINWTKNNGKWKINIQYPTHQNHADFSVLVMWIPRQLVDDTVGFSTNP